MKVFPSDANPEWVISPTLLAFRVISYVHLKWISPTQKFKGQ
jgi:hypothetical protein